MTEIVTSRGKYDAEPLIEAVEAMARYCEALDEIEDMRGLRPLGRTAPMSMRVAEALSVVHDVRADESWDNLAEWEQELLEASKAELVTEGGNDNV